jgi:hypothetical protein
MQGMAANSAAKAQARAEQQNARLVELQGEDAVRRGGREEEKFRRQLAIHQGQQRAVLAASGVDIDSGSAAELQEASLMEGEEDAAVIRLNAQREKWGFDMQALNHRNAASAARSAGKNAMTAGIVGGATSLLSGAYSAGLFGKAGAGAGTGKIVPETTLWGGYDPSELEFLRKQKKFQPPMPTLGAF